MAESEATVPLSTEDQQINNDVETDEKNDLNLKRLGFVQAAAIYVFVCFTTLYDYAKANSGPLKHGVQTVEGAVKTVIGPVYEKFHHVPFDLLKFVDIKVDESITKLDHHIPSLLKQISLQALTTARKTPQATRELLSEIHQTGLITAASSFAKATYVKYEPVAKEVYDKYEPVAEQYLVLTWRTLDGLPLFSQVARITVPTASYWAEKYNRAVAYMAEEGYVVSSYLPLVPIERIAKMFEGVRGDGDLRADDEDAVLANGG